METLNMPDANYILNNSNYSSFDLNEQQDIDHTSCGVLDQENVLWDPKDAAEYHRNYEQTLLHNFQLLEEMGNSTGNLRIGNTLDKVMSPPFNTDDNRINNYHELTNFRPRKNEGEDYIKFSEDFGHNQNVQLENSFLSQVGNNSDAPLISNIQQKSHTSSSYKRDIFLSNAGVLKSSENIVHNDSAILMQTDFSISSNEYPIYFSSIGNVTQPKTDKEAEQYNIYSSNFYPPPPPPPPPQPLPLPSPPPLPLLMENSATCSRRDIHVVCKQIRNSHSNLASKSNLLKTGEGSRLSRDKKNSKCKISSLNKSDASSVVEKTKEKCTVPVMSPTDEGILTRKTTLVQPGHRRLKSRCTWCGDRHATRYSLITHIKSHRQPYCKLCLVVQSSHQQLHGHMTRRHPLKPSRMDQTPMKLVTSKYGRRRCVLATSELLIKQGRRRLKSKDKQEDGEKFPKT